MGGARSRDDDGEVFVFREIPLDVRGVVGEPADTGNGKACLTLVGEGSGAAARAGGLVTLPLGSVGPEPLEVNDESSASSPTRLRLVSVLGVSVPICVSLSTRRSGVEREGPNAGDEYRFLDRGVFALPPPCHR